MGHKKTNTNKEHHIKKQNKNIEQNTDPYKNLVNSGASERLAVPASCRTPVMLFIVNDMYIEYSGFHTNGFNQDTHICFTHYNFAQYFQDSIYWTQPIKTSSFFRENKFRFIIFIKIKKVCSPPHYFCLENPKNKNFFLLWPKCNFPTFSINSVGSIV